MQSTFARVVLLALLAVVAVGLFLVLSEEETDESADNGGATTQVETTTAPPEPAFERIVLRDGEAAGGVRELTYAKGDDVRIEVVLDEPQEDVHIHGYEIERLNPSGTVRFDFPASIDGIFELEAHGPDGDVPLAEIRVTPG